MVDTADLDNLFSAATGLVPILQGEVGDHAAGWVSPGADNAATLRQLYAVIRETNPEAGAAFWSASCWNHLNWQPVAIALLAVHHFALLPKVGCMSQCLRQGGVGGFRLPSPHCIRGARKHLVREAGCQLRELAESLIADMSRLAKEAHKQEFATVKQITAKRLLADRILGLLLRIGRHDPSLGNEELQDCACAWLEAAGLESMSALSPITLSDGREQLILERKACCMAYLCADGAICESCPTQQSRDMRLQRQKDYWEHHA
ncbi:MULTISPECIES: siderophore ferric iron reductase [Microvirga]|nr:siderophore ferric iron reductase [Microvirga arsenatis]